MPTEDEYKLGSYRLLHHGVFVDDCPIIGCDAYNTLYRLYQTELQCLYRPVYVECTAFSVDYLRWSLYGPQ